MKSNSDIEMMLHQDAESIPIDLEFKNDLKKRIMMQEKEKETVKVKNTGKLIFFRRASAAAIAVMVIGGSSIGLSSKFGAIGKSSKNVNYALNESKKIDSNNIGAKDIYLKGDKTNLSPSIVIKDDINSQKENTNIPPNSTTMQKQESANNNDQIAVSNSNGNNANTNISGDNSTNVPQSEGENSSISKESPVDNTVSQQKPAQNTIVTDINKVYAVSGNGEASKNEQGTESEQNTDIKEEDTMTKTLLQEENKIYIMDIKTKQKILIDEGRKAELIEDGNYVAYIKDEANLADKNTIKNSVTTPQVMNLLCSDSSVWIYNVKTMDKQLITRCSDIKEEALKKDVSKETKQSNINSDNYYFAGLMWSKSAKQLYVLVNDKETKKEQLIRLQFDIKTNEQIKK